MKTRVHRVTIPFRLNPNGELFLVACTSLRPPRKVESKVAPGFTTAWVAARSVEGFLLLEVPGKYRSSHSSKRKLFKSRLVLARAPLGNIYVAFGNARVGAPARVTTRFLLIPGDVEAWPTSPCACFVLARRPFPFTFITSLVITGAHFSGPHAWSSSRDIRLNFNIVLVDAPSTFKMLCILENGS